jgi:hypothetical protein
MTAPSSLAAALAAVQADLPDIRKTETAKVSTKAGVSYSYSYADLAAVSRVILPRLGKVGLSWTTKPTLVEDRFVLVYKLLHISGECEEGTYPLPDRGTPQEVGSAITYARRYALCSVTGVAPDDDDDAAEATGGHKRNQQMATQSRDDEWESAQPARPAPSPAPKNPGNDPARRRMYALLGKAELTDREAKLAYVVDVIGRPVDSSNDLTDAEVRAVCDRLESFIKQTDPSGVSV